MIKEKRNYFCPYCGEEYNNKKWTFDHIIPLGLGGSKKFKILSCLECNNKISKIEQRVIQTDQIRDLMVGLGEDGFKMRTRRKKDYIPLHKKVGFLFGAPTKFFYNPKENYKGLDILGLPKDMSMDKFLEKMSRGGAIIVPAEETDMKKEALILVSFVDKIILGACYWLWNERFSKSKHAYDLRKRIWNVKLGDILEMDSSDHHIVWKEENKDNNSEEEKDAFDNAPHHTIYIFCKLGMILGLVNLFGKYESMVRIGKPDKKFDVGLNGIVLIIKTTENEVSKMSLEEYEKMKNNPST